MVLYPPIGLKSMQNSTFLAVLRLIFALKREIAPPKDREMSSRSGCQLTEKRSEIR